MGLKIVNIDSDPALADIVYRIQTICRLIFDSSPTFKIYATEDSKVMRGAAPAGIPNLIPSGIPHLVQTLDVVQMEQGCPKCGFVNKIYYKLADKPQIDNDFQNLGFASYSPDDKVKCKQCGFEIDLTAMRQQIESQLGRKIIK